MFIGREKELESLRSLLAKRTGSLVACRGRRRIGKSTLIEEFARINGCRFIEIDGLMPREGMTNEAQLLNFSDKLGAATKREIGAVANWREAFDRLNEAIGDSEWTVVLLDEISWMGKCDPDFPGQLKSAWDSKLKKHDRLIVVVCGSVSAWISKNILKSAGFAGRFSRDIVLKELPISLCRQFWGVAADRIASREILDVLSVTGGVPRYLEEIDPTLSADENIRRLCFQRDGTLFNDFEAIFSQVFGADCEVKRSVLEILSEGPKTCSEIAEALGVGRGGSISESLDVLAESGFVAKDEGYNPETGKPARQSRYRICDNYTRFYLKYIKPHEFEILADRYAVESLEYLPEWNAWLGYQFENLVVNNANELFERLHLGGIPVLSAAPYMKRGKRRADGSHEPGLQIDLLVQTRRSVCIVEVKRKKEIDESVEKEVAEKLRRLSVPEGVSKRTALVYEGSLAPVVRGNGFFDAVISSDDLFRP